MAAEAQRLGERLRHRWEAEGRSADGVPINILALSGGGPDGAFAAGLLNGWSTTGTRPQFQLVTGISIGALIAPFAFLGTDYDPALRKLFTEFDTSDVLIFRPFALLFGALGLIDTAPLRATIRTLVDEEMLRRVAAEHRKGRRLLIGTTNIDAGRPVVWNMGAIAEAGDVDLFGDVMLASASIPGAFPPVLIDVTAEGERFTEFHVDGGVTRSVILWPDGTERLFAHVSEITRSGSIYVIQNNQLLPPYQPVESSVRQIAARSLSTLIRGQTEGDLTRIYLAAQRVGYDFRLIFVPPNDAAPGTTDFDTNYMRRLFETAERIGRAPIPWLHEPPGVADRREVQKVVRAAFQTRDRRPPVAALPAR
jgi:predicted acylesterase/phospholipase RssA